MFVSITKARLSAPMARGLVHRLLSIAIVAAIALTSLLQFPLPSFAEGLQTAPDIEEPAILISLKSDRPIPIALRPAPNQPNVGYGISGHSVTVLEQVGDYLAFDDPSTTWCHIRLDDKPFTEGWIQGKYLSFPAP